ncbi:MAG TPA: chromate efflux transporter [Xanthobacteraceae bacterium]|nr:chromate efflux transporter [Xanthobacteraceae bacterium]
MPVPDTAESKAAPGRWPEVFAVFLRLGLTSFGGPVAHLGYFHTEVVERRRWLDERSYVDLVALCQFLPGPASSQTGIGIGLLRAGIPGALAAWAGFTLPSAIAMVLFAYGLGTLQGALGSGWLHGLKIAAVAVVAQAVWGMARSLCPDRPRATLAVFAAVVVLLVPTAWGQIGAIAAGGIIGLVALHDAAARAGSALHVPIAKRLALTCLASFFALLAGLPLLDAATGWQPLALFDSFYRSGSLVFGGGHVVLPLLQAEVVPPGWVSNDDFLAGYGAAQAVPGPLFTFSAYLGAVMKTQPSGWIGAIICLVAVFLPSFLLVFGALPFWAALRGNPRAQAALRGINAAVVGLLLAALYRPVWVSAITAPVDFALAAVAFLALALWKWPPWIVVVLAAVAGGLIAHWS